MDSLRKCDIVMQGGVTSGVVYPGLVCKLAEKYSFQSIGGTSVGAIAACLTAAAEYSRRNGQADAFAGVAAVSQWLGEDSKSGSGSNMLALFQPQTWTRDLFRFAMAFLIKGFWRRALAIVWLFVIEIVVGTIPALVLHHYCYYLVGWRYWLVLALIALVVGVVAFWAIVQTSHLDRSLGRWEQTRATWERDARWVADRVAIKALPQAGALGFGPGTFSAVFPQFQQGAGERAQGSWLFLHDDYLQTLLEWGWVGGLLWAGLFFGGIIVALRSLAGRPHPNPLPRGEGKAWLRASDRHEGVQWLPRQRMVLSLALVALGGVALHAAVDFPLQISSIQLYAATYLGVCWGAGRWPRQRVSS